MKKIVDPLLKWYLENKRTFPWREDKDPYHVWISEIMLQQTRIEAVLNYYDRFMKRLPTIQSLSEVEEDELLKLWQGLGYYSRARNLKKAAQKMINDYQGEFPKNYEDILKLPGIGEYTAGAISSICFGLPEVAIDGNVMRVYSRVANVDIDITSPKERKKIASKIKQILPKNSGDFNEAIMELGEVICIPNGLPKCEICPLKEICKAHILGRESSLPRKAIKKEKQEEDYTVFLMKCNGKIAIQKRESGLLKNMWEFPNEIGFLSIEQVKEKFSQVKSIKPSISNTHIFTHKKWYMKSYLIELDKEIEPFQWVSLEEIEKDYAIPTAFFPFLEYMK